MMNRLFRFLPMLVLCGLANVAQAFKLEILDPPTGGPYTYFVGGTSPIAFQFGVCPTNQPALVGADGCFIAYNNTANTTFRSLSLSFDNYSSPANPNDTFNYLNGQAAVCDVSPSNTAFTSAPICGLSSNRGTYNLVFSGGPLGFYPTEYIVIAEFGASQFAFQNASFAASPNLVAATPEPESLWLLATGAGLPAAAWWKRRRSATGACSGA